MKGGRAFDDCRKAYFLLQLFIAPAAAQAFICETACAF
jgi:hypothetical protein